MQSSRRLSQVKSVSALDAAESGPAVLHAAFEEIEKRWGIDRSNITANRKAYPRIPEWQEDQPYGKLRFAWRIYFHRFFSYLHKTQKN